MPAGPLPMVVFKQNDHYIFSTQVLFAIAPKLLRQSGTVSRLIFRLWMMMSRAILLKVPEASTKRLQRDLVETKRLSVVWYKGVLPTPL